MCIRDSHSAAGLQLRDACARLMDTQGREEPVGGAKLTPAYNLPSRFVLHTVGPRVNGALTQRHRQQLAGCYRACLALAARAGLESVAFCCVSTGEFRFPPAEAAPIAVDTVMDFLAGEKRVDVYKRQGYRYTGASPVATQIRFLSCRYIALHSLQNTVFFIVAQKKALFQFLYKSFMQNLCRYGIL